MPDSPLVAAARQWVIDTYPYNSNHLLKTLEWLDRIAPDANEPTRLAALTHDMERAFPGTDQPVHHVIRGFDDHEYNAAHAARSARIVGRWLRNCGTEEAFVQEVERLIQAHEDGGWPEANLVQAADSLSFLEVNVDLFLNMARSGKRTLDEVCVKFDYTYERIQVSQARELALPLYEQARARLETLRPDRS
jgi:hypothetical protein